MPGSKQGRLDNTDNAKLSNRAGSQQSSAFDDQLNRQIDRSRMSESDENNLNNQYDSSPGSDPAMAGEGNEEPSGILTEETHEGEPITPSGLTESSLQTTELSTQLIDVEAVIQGAESATELPDSGKTLPLSVLNSSSTNAAQPIQGNREFSTKPLADINLQQLALNTTIKQAQTQQAFKAASIKDAAGLGASSMSVDLMPLKPSMMNERLSLQNTHMNSSMSEFSAMDMISQASRLQQVPLSTSLSASSPGAQNINVMTTAALDSTAFSQLLPVGKTLSSSIGASIQSPQWGQQMTEQVSVMLKGGVQQAEIKLNPANLGPMEIKLSLNDDQASVSFIAQHAPVREALDAALPRLREMLEQQGLNLADVDVSTQSEQQQAEDQSAGDEVSFDDRDRSDAEELADSTDVLQDATDITHNMQHSKAINIFA